MTKGLKGCLSGQLFYLPGFFKKEPRTEETRSKKIKNHKRGDACYILIPATESFIWILIWDFFGACFLEFFWILFLRLLELLSPTPNLWFLNLHLMSATQKDDSHQSLVISYLTLRKAVGILGMALPFLLTFGYFFFERECTFPPSISHFYYTDLGNLFVGTLCAVSLFLFSYNGHDRGDMIAAKIAGLFALLVALFPTDFGGYAEMFCSRMTDGENKVANFLHYISATILFSTFAFFSLVQFTKTDKRGPMAAPKRTRNFIYKICGWVIVACIAGIAVVSLVLPPEAYLKLKPYKPTFVLETIALWAFGFSWLIKGETFFRDKV